jgi:hypothetical protein
VSHVRAIQSSNPENDLRATRREARSQLLKLRADTTNSMVTDLFNLHRARLRRHATWMIALFPPT